MSHKMHVCKFHNCPEPLFKGHPVSACMYLYTCDIHTIIYKSQRLAHTVAYFQKKNTCTIAATIFIG